jgi:5-methylcytosine-specific restriction endonuclease McrA
MVRALVLNATYEPLSVVPTRRAVVLVMRGRAISVVDRDETWYSERATVSVPSVVKLTSFVKVPYRRSVPVTRRAVFGRDGHVCQYCGDQAESIDHVLPRSRGGHHSWDNVVACCRSCNMRKGNRLPREAGMALHAKPQAPRHYAWIYASAGYTLDPAWQPYLKVAG